MRWLGNAHRNRSMGNRLWWLFSTTQSWASSSTSTDETTNIIKQKWMVAVILMTVLGLVRMIDSFRGRLTAITRRIIGLSTHEPPRCSITHTHSVTHSPCLYSSLSPTISGPPLPRPLLRPSHQRLIWTLHLSSFQDYFEGMNLPSSRRQTRKRQR